MTAASRTPIIAMHGVAPANRIAEAIMDVVGRVPGTLEPGGGDPMARARAICQRSAQKAALTAGGLALPAGSLGWLTVLPELVAVWRLQAQMVADIAGAFDRRAELGREQMIYCLFRHTAAQAMRDLVARVGERWLVQRVPLATLQRIARSIGIGLTRRAITRAVSRWLPIAGAIGVGAYAWYDTRQVGETAIALFSQTQLEHDPRIVATVERIEPPAR